MLCVSFSFSFLFGVTLPRAAHLIIYAEWRSFNAKLIVFLVKVVICVNLKIYNFGQEIDVVL